MTSGAASGSARCLPGWRWGCKGWASSSISCLAVGIWGRKFTACQPRYSPDSGRTSVAGVVQAGASEFHPGWNVKTESLIRGHVNKH